MTHITDKSTVGARFTGDVVDRWACEPGSVPRPVARTAVATIHLGRALPHGSSSLPGRSGEQPSNAPCMALLRTGFTEPHRSPGALVVSYTTFSP